MRIRTVLASTLLTSPWILACSISATAPPAAPNLPDPGRSEATGVVDFVDAPDAPLCSKHGGLKDFCVRGFWSALTPGLQQVVARYYRPSSKSDHDFHARFRLIEFSHSPTSGGSKQTGPSVQVAMRWHFTLKKSDGSTVIDLTENTVGPQQLIDVSASDTVVAALDNAVLERIAKAIGEARDKQDSTSKEAAPTKPAPPAARACVPGATQECVAPGACHGGQACLPDGTGYSPCDCGGASDGGAAPGG